MTSAENPWFEPWADAASGGLFVLLAFGLPLLGYVFLILDVRAYWRSLRRALVRVATFSRDAPVWVRWHTPRSVAVFGLTMPCTEEALLAAYRAKVKEVHPDQGGDRREFQLWQRRFEEALEVIRGVEEDVD